MRLSDASNMFLEVKAQEGFSPYTVHAYRLQHELLIRDIGDVEVGQVTLQLLRAHLNHHSHLKPASVGHKIRAIKSLFNWLVEEELLLRNPTLKVSEPKRGKILNNNTFCFETVLFNLGAGTCSMSAPDEIDRIHIISEHYSKRRRCDW